MLQRILEWDRNAFVYLNNLGIEQFDGLWSMATNYSTWLPLFVIFFLLLLLKFTRREALLMALTVVLLAFFMDLTTDFTKEFVSRLRPNHDTAINTPIRILRNPSGFSFFSSHASISFSITTLMYLYLRKKVPWAWLFYIWPFLFSFSRIYIGVHFPTDIIAGALAGMLAAGLFYLLYKRLIGPWLSPARL
jgi:undecaprenyl-diphosphatase